MMKGRIRDYTQTILIALLTLSLLALVLAIWLLETPVEWDSAGPAAVAARLLRLVTPPPETIIVPRGLQYGEAARPVCVVWTEGGRHWAAQLDTALTDSAFDRLKGRFSEAMGSAGPPARQVRSAWLEALSSDSLYLEYASAQPLRAVALWLSSENAALPDVSVRRLALVSTDGAVTFWFVDERDGAPYMCRTSTPARDFPGAHQPGALPCRFGFEDAAFQRAPLCLLFDQTPAPSEAVCEPVSLSPPTPEVDAFLKALHINPDTNARFPDEEGTTYLGDRRSCRFSRDGSVHYVNPDASDKPLSPLSAAPQTAEAIEQARELLAALSPLPGQARFSLNSAEPSEDGASVTVTFVYELSGLTVRLADGMPPAVLVFRNGQLASADVRVLSFSLGGQPTEPLLSAQIAYLALAATHPYGDIELRLYYSECDGVLTPGWENY